MSTVITAEVAADISKVLSWIDTHPDGKWDDMGELFAVYKRWRDIIRGNPPLLDNMGTMHAVPGLSSFGRLFLLEHPPQEGTAAKSDTPADPIGFLGGAALADALGVHATRRDAFFRQLERKRISLGDDCWHEMHNPRPNCPRFLYRADSPKLRDQAAAYKNPKLA